MGVISWFRSKKKKLDRPHAAQPEGNLKSPADLDRLLGENEQLRAQLLLQNEALVKQVSDVATGTATREEQALESGAGGFAELYCWMGTPIFSTITTCAMGGLEEGERRKT